MPRYTIAVCNYNMAATIEQSLRSMLDQVDDRFEVVVVDGGSTDGSVTAIEDLMDEYDRLRLVALDPDPNRRLGADRNTSFEAADGEFILESLDVDDVYEPVLVDFVEIYEQLNSQVEGDFYLDGHSINIAPRRLLLEVPYRNLDGSEDTDLVRRLIDRDAVVFLDHDRVKTQVGYEKDARSLMERWWDAQVADFQCGIGLFDHLSWLVDCARGAEHTPSYSPKKLAYEFGISPLTYAVATLARKRYETPEPVRRKGTVYRTRQTETRTLAEIESHYGVEIDRSRLSERGREVFCQ